MKNKKNKKIFKGNRDRVGIEVIGADKSAFEDFADSVSSPWRVFFLGLLKGAGFSLGILIGGAILLTLLTYIVNILVEVPVFGEWLKGLVDNIAQNMK
jgi:hypothetical protein